jgi:RNA polymerase sigma-32 factor
LEREGFYPGPKLLAERLQVKESEVIEMEQRLGSPDMSVDAPLNEDAEGGLLSVLPSEVRDAEEIVGDLEVKALLQENLDLFRETLNKKERVIFEERMVSEQKATLQDLAEKLSLSRERIRQIENKIKEKLKTFLEDQLGSQLDTIEF